MDQYDMACKVRFVHPASQADPDTTAELKTCRPFLTGTREEFGGRGYNARARG